MLPPGPSCSTARHRARAAPAPAAPRAQMSSPGSCDDDLRDVGEASRQCRRDRLAQRRRAGGRRAAAPSRRGSTLRRREERDQVGDGDAERLAGLVKDPGDQRLSPAAASLHRVLACRARRAARASAVPRTSSAAAARIAGRRRDRGQAAAEAAVRAVAAGRDDEVAEIGAEPVRAAEKLAAMHDAEAERVLDRDDQEIVEAAAVAEPVLGQGDEVDVAVDGHGDAEPGLQVVCRRSTSRSRKSGL